MLAKLDRATAPAREKAARGAEAGAGNSMAALKTARGIRGWEEEGAEEAEGERCWGYGRR